MHFVSDEILHFHVSGSWGWFPDVLQKLLKLFLIVFDGQHCHPVGSQGYNRIACNVIDVLVVHGCQPQAEDDCNQAEKSGCL